LLLKGQDGHEVIILTPKVDCPKVQKIKVGKRNNYGKSAACVGDELEEVEILAIQEKVRAIMDWIEHTDDLLEIFEKDEEVASDLRAVASLMKSRRDDFVNKIEGKDLKVNL
jgi:hypothetical protein